MNTERPHEPTAPPKHAVQGRGDTRPPPPPAELPRHGPDERHFTHDGVEWIAYVSGKGACGTGSYGLGLVEAVHFSVAAAPDRPLREALLPRGRFAELFDSELAAVLDGATPIVEPNGR